jgi:hypothetical protein
MSDRDAWSDGFDAGFDAGKDSMQTECDRLLAQVSELAGTVEWRDREVARLRAALERLNVRWFVSNQMRRRIASEALEDR